MLKPDIRLELSVLPYLLETQLAWVYTALTVSPHYASHMRGGGGAVFAGIKLVVDNGLIVSILVVLSALAYFLVVTGEEATFGQPTQVQQEDFARVALAIASCGHGRPSGELLDDDQPDRPDVLFLYLVLPFLIVMVCSSPRKLMVRFQIDVKDIEHF